MTQSRPTPPPAEPGLNQCFGCGPTNPVGLRLSFVIERSGKDELTATANVHLAACYEGGPGNLHGGMIATLMDEVMSKLNKPLGVRAVTRNLEVDYLHPAKVLTDLKLIGTHLRRDGRKLFHSAELQDVDGKVLAKAKAVFIVVVREA